MSTCTDDDQRTLRIGTKEFVTATLEANVTLDTQDVFFSIDDGENWLAATPVDGPGTTRKYRHLFLPAELPPSPGIHELIAKVVDDPEEPIFSLGYITITT